MAYVDYIEDPIEKTKEALRIVWWSVRQKCPYRDGTRAYKDWWNDLLRDIDWISADWELEIKYLEKQEDN